MSTRARSAPAPAGVVMALLAALLVNTLLMLFVHALTSAPASRPAAFSPTLRATVLPPDFKPADEFERRMPLRHDAPPRPSQPQLAEQPSRPARGAAAEDARRVAAAGPGFAAPRIDLPDVPTGGAYLGDMMQGDNARLAAPPEAWSKDGEKWAVPNTRFGPVGGASSSAADSPMLPGISTDLVPLYRVEPAYPKQALSRGIEGEVLLEFTIGSDGRVRDIEVLSSPSSKVFHSASRNALAQWLFQPEVVDGRPVARRARQTLRFTLDN